MWSCSAFPKSGALKKAGLKENKSVKNQIRFKEKFVYGASL